MLLIVLFVQGIAGKVIPNQANHSVAGRQALKHLQMIKIKRIFTTSVLVSNRGHLNL